MSTFYMRNPEVAAIARGEAFYFLRKNQGPLEISPTNVQALSETLQALAMPLSEEALDGLLDEDTKTLFVEGKLLLSGTKEELLARLLGDQKSERPCGHLVFAVTGAVASMHTASIVFELFHTFAKRIDVIFTEAAQHFVNPEIFSFLGIQTWTDAFTPKGDINVPHIYLANTADLIVVLPASAHTLYKLAHGACNDLLSLTICATKAPVVLVPAMNHAMWNNPAVARNVKQLREDGLYVVEPSVGVEVARKQEVVPEYGSSGLVGFNLTSILSSILELRTKNNI
jgi:phosphopantothenoylcysteine decarboxylase/phosphopantothenate--cysteine ligase